MDIARRVIYSLACRSVWALFFSMTGLAITAWAQDGSPTHGIVPEEVEDLLSLGFPGVLLVLGWWARDLVGRVVEKLPDMRDGVPIVVCLSEEDRKLLRKED